MAIGTFTWCPAPGIGLIRKPRLLIAGYGDGYVHRSVSGINVIGNKRSATFNGDQDYIQAIDTFLEDNYLTGFWWPWVTGNVAPYQLFTCDTWQLSWTDKGGNGKLLGSLQAEFDQAYNYQPGS